MQFISVLSFIDANHSSYAEIFFELCILFANLDIFSGEELFSIIFSFKETTPLNSIFEKNGVDSKNYISNSGSFLIIIIGLLINHVVIKALIWLCKKFGHFKCARYFGKWLDTKDQSIADVHKSILKLFMETYFDNSLATILSIYGFIEDKDNFKLYWRAGNDIFSSVMTIIMIIAIIAFPIWVKLKLNEMRNMTPK